MGNQVYVANWPKNADGNGSPERVALDLAVKIDELEALRREEPVNDYRAHWLTLYAECLHTVRGKETS